MDLLAIAKAVADRAEAEATRTKVPASVCVIDIHGNLVFALEIAERKAYTSALVGLRTAELDPMVQPGQPLFSLLALAGGRYCAMGGGVPLTRDGQLIGGVGVSGGTVDQDIAIVEAAIR